MEVVREGRIRSQGLLAELGIGRLPRLGPTESLEDFHRAILASHGHPWYVVDRRELLIIALAHRRGDLPPQLGTFLAVDQANLARRRQTLPAAASSCLA
jgi:hypothetical protein